MIIASLNASRESAVWFQMTVLFPVEYSASSDMEALRSSLSQSMTLWTESVEPYATPAATLGIIKGIRICNIVALC